MKKLLGKPLAQEILDKVKAEVEKMDRRPILKVVCSDKDQPYYKGIVKDAAYCGIRVWTKGAGDFDGAISLDTSYTPQLSDNLDGGWFTPCTAEAVMELLRYYCVPIAGKNVLIIGRSERVGKPLTNLMLDADATVTTCHSKTDNLYWHMCYKDIVVSCVGDAGFDGRGITNQYMTLVDIGGDFTNVDACAAVAPAVRGVGPVTRAVLMRHLMEKIRKDK